jgi:hypothetical protein
MSKLIQYHRQYREYECDVCGICVTNGLYINQATGWNWKNDSLYMCQRCISKVEVLSVEQEVRLCPPSQ